MIEYRRGTSSGPLVSRRTLGRSVAAATGLAVAGRHLLASTAARAAAPAFKTAVPGFITVATVPAPPVTEVKGDQFLGTDGEMISTIAKRLGLTARPAFMEWSATIESVKTGRADVMLANMGWTPQRSRIMLCTDAIYYTGAFVTMKADMPVKDRVTVKDFAGHSVGAVTGVTIVPELKKVPGISEVKLYDTFDGCVRDIAAGRLDFGVLDAPFVADLIRSHQSIGLKQLPIAQDADYPILTSKQNTVMGMNAQNTDLFDAVNTGVRWLWATKRNAAILAQYGMSDPDYLTPVTPDPRLGVDRDAKGDVIGPNAHAMKDFSALFA
jgi:polar amino acid transport system substrate-binding protein